MSASEKISRNKKSVGFEDVAKVSPRESRSRSRGMVRDRRAKSMDLRGGAKEGEPRKRDRSLIGLVRQGSRKSVTSLVKLFEAGKSFYMTEGRKCQILLPDERRLEILIQFQEAVTEDDYVYKLQKILSVIPPKLLTWELLDIVASHFKLKEKDYFGLAFQDETGHYFWLQHDKKVLEHDLPRKQGTNLVISFLVRFYVESITQLRDTSTVELFYLNAKQSVFKGQIECDSETVFELAAHVLQATIGDFVDDQTTKSDLKKLPLITTSALKEHPSIQYCEDRVIDYYKKIAGTTKGSAIVNYMTIIESLPTYGIHYFEVKDKKDIPWWLGISNKGIGVYDKQDKNVPRRVFVWKSLENLYYRDRKFSIEVHDPKRIVHTLSSFNLYEDAIRERVEDNDDLSEAITDPSTQVSVSRRTFGPGNVNVHAWFGLTPQLTKCIWSMAVAQHQFYHERKSSKTSLPSVRSVSELATELSRSTSSLPGSLGSDISRSGSSASLPSLGASRFDLNFDPADTAKVQREMYSALKARREALEDILRKKTEELKTLCIKEGELTGSLPPETPLVAGEEPPQIRRRVGTAFSLDTNMVSADKESEDMASKLELELELQKQITSAAHKLASDKSVSRFVRKQRRHSFIKAQNKLKEMEKKLSEYRKGGVPVSPALSGKYDGKSIKSLDMTDSDSDVVSPAASPLVPRGPRSNYKQHEGRLDSNLHRSNTAPKNFALEREIVSMTLPPTHSSPTLEEVYKPNSVYSTEYRNQTYPTLASRSQSQTSSHSDYENKSGSQGRLDSSQYDNKSSGQGRLDGSQGHLEGSQDSGFSSTNNMYNVNSRRTSRYESNQDLNTHGESHYETLDNVFDNRLHIQSKPGNLGNVYNQNSYGSLERNLKKRQNREYERKLSDTDASSEISNNTPSRFGKRTSKSEYDLSSKGRDQQVSSKETDFPLSHRARDYMINSPTLNYPSRSDRYNTDRHDSVASSRMIEVPVHHETVRPSSNRPDRNLDFYQQSRTAWKDSASTEPSPIIQSPPHRTFNEPYSTSSGGESSQGQCYSPRGYEGTRALLHSKPPHPDHKISVNVIDSPHGVPQATSSKIVTVKMSPHVEVSKPFEMKDFYKYSEKLRRQRLVEQYHNALVGSRANSPSQHSESDAHHSNSSSSSSYHHPQGVSHGSHYGQSTSSQVHPAYRGTSTSSASPFSSPVSSRHMINTHPYGSQSNSSQDHTGYGNYLTDSVSSSSGSAATYGVSTTTSRVQYTVQTQGGRVLYKAQHQSSKQTHYQPPTSMKCEPVRSSRDIRKGSHEAPPTPTSSRNAQRGVHHQRQYSTPERSVQSPLNISNFHLSPAGSLSKAFSNEMLEWFDGEGNQAPTSV